MHPDNSGEGWSWQCERTYRGHANIVIPAAKEWVVVHSHCRHFLFDLAGEGAVGF